MQAAAASLASTWDTATGISTEGKTVCMQSFPQWLFFYEKKVEKFFAEVTV